MDPKQKCVKMFELLLEGNELLREPYRTQAYGILASHLNDASTELRRLIQMANQVDDANTPSQN